MNSDQLEQEIKNIKKRNIEVGGNKAWETSWSRKFLIFIFTYLAIGIYLYIIDIDRPWLNAIVPALAFMLSTLTMPYFKKIWLKYFYKK